jgi:hypothetical protein
MYAACTIRATKQWTASDIFLPAHEKHSDCTCGMQGPVLVTDQTGFVTFVAETGKGTNEERSPTLSFYYP